MAVDQLTSMTDHLDALRSHAIPGRVAILPGRGSLPKIVVTTGRSTTEIYPHGAHVTRFQKAGEAPLIFLSDKSWFEAGKPIRGGVPICFPWFGGREGAPAHGIARITEWQLTSASAAPDGTVNLRWELPRTGDRDEWGPLRAEFLVTVSDALTMELVTTCDVSRGATHPITFESCLHTYLEVGDIEGVSITGLAGLPFDDFTAGRNGARAIEHDAALHVTRETNRVYPDHTGTVEVHDRQLQRTIRVAKSGSHSTVVWNPWTTQKLPEDFDPADYRRMVCVESGNVKQNAVSLAPGEVARLMVTIGST
jgi:D-hexose-6-phosphate mutarotase